MKKYRKCLFILYPDSLRASHYVSVNAFLQESCKSITNPNKEFFFHELAMYYCKVVHLYSNL